MNTVDLQQQKIRAELEQLRAELDKLKAQADESSAEKQIKFDRYLDTLDEKRNEVGEKLEALKDSGDDAIDDIKEGLKEAWQRLAIAKTAAKIRFH